jgi:pilus assembly protein CpaE
MTIVLAPTLHEADRYRFTLASDVVPVASAGDLEEVLQREPEHDLVIIAPDVEWRSALDIAERYRMVRPDLGVIAQRRRIDVASLNQALRAGIRELVDADDAAALVAAASRSREISAALSRKPSAGVGRRGQLVVVFSPKGGTGKTMLATNLAVALGLDEVRTCLVDLDLQFGDVAIALGLEPTRTTSDAIGLRDAVDEHALNSLLLDYRSNISVLPSPTRPADADFISSELVTNLLEALLAMHDVVIVDTPPSFTEHVLRALDMADVHLLVATPDMASLKSMRVALDTLNALGYPATKRRIILNRDEPNLGLSLGDMRAIIHTPITARIPVHRDVVVALNRGRTIVEENARNPVSRAIRLLARQLLVETPATTPAAVG